MEGRQNSSRLPVGDDFWLSKFEEKIARILIDARVPFIREKTFKDLKHGYLRFDFYFPLTVMCCEIDGPQHMEYTKFFHKKRSDFTKAQERDRVKNSYCLAHEIPLYRIPYWEMDNIHCVDDIFQDKFLVRSKYHNDNIYREYRKSLE